MGQNVSATIEELDNNVVEMINRYARLSDRCKTLEADLQEKCEEIKQMQNLLEEMQNKYQSLKTAQVVVARNSDIEVVRARFDKLVREVDKCILLLND